MYRNSSYIFCFTREAKEMSVLFICLSLWDKCSMCELTYQKSLLCYLPWLIYCSLQMADINLFKWPCLRMSNVSFRVSFPMPFKPSKSLGSLYPLCSNVGQYSLRPSSFSHSCTSSCMLRETNYFHDLFAFSEEKFMSMISELQVSSVVIISFLRYLIKKAKTVAEQSQNPITVMSAFVPWKILSIQADCILSMKVL